MDDSTGKDEYRFLIIDDDPAIRTLVAAFLEVEFPGCTVRPVADEATFHRHLADGGFDLVVTDYLFGWADGLEVLAAVKQRYPLCPVVMFTGSGSEEVAVKAMKAGLDDYVLKHPKHQERLPVAVRSALDRAKARREKGALAAELDDTTAARMQAEERLQESEKRFRTIFEGSADGIMAADIDRRRIEFANPEMCTMLGYSQEELIQMNISDLHPRDLFPGIDEKFDNYAHNSALSPLGIPFLKKDGGIIYCDIKNRIMIIGGRTLVVGFFRDSTERVRTELLLRAQRDLGLAVNNADDLAEILRLCVEFAIENTGMDCGGIYLRDEASGSMTLEYHKGLSDPFLESISYYSADHPSVKLVQQGCPVFTHYGRIDVPKDSSRLKENLRAIAILPIAYRGRIIASLHVASHEIDEIPDLARLILQTTVSVMGESIVRKKAKEELKRSLAEKEILLREIHHRVKNNLQTVASLLRLQVGAGGKEGTAKDVLSNCQRRIHAIAFIHEKLYQSSDLRHINLGEYLGELAEHVLKSAEMSRGNITLVTDTEPVRADIDTAIPCGLIISELVNNAVQHAFPGTAGGTIRLTISKDTHGTVTITVSDDGGGLPEGFDIEQAGSLGLQLVKDLAEEQLKGKLSLSSENGTTVTMTFPLLEATDKEIAIHE